MTPKLDLNKRIADFFEQMTYEKNISYTPKQIIAYLIEKTSESEALQFGFLDRESLIRFIRRNVGNILNQSTSGKRNWRKAERGRYQFYLPQIEHSGS